MPLRTENDRTCSRLLGDATITYTIDIKDQFSNFKSRKAKRILETSLCVSYVISSKLKYFTYVSIGIFLELKACPMTNPHRSVVVSFKTYDRF